jgi:hypothetical protein
MDSSTRKSGDVPDREFQRKIGDVREGETVLESPAVENLRRSKSTKELPALENNNTNNSGSTATTSSGGSVGGSILDGATNLLRANARPKKNHRCEVIVISGAAGE